MIVLLLLFEVSHLIKENEKKIENIGLKFIIKLLLLEFKTFHCCLTNNNSEKEIRSSIYLC